ncbi:MAG: polysaccharide deacetylase family protein [Alphaproteobacteria bacterium]|nr:polysaccharide deacetylase family protein [Alphaproteobacteria bacterium SS10]
MEEDAAWTALVDELDAWSSAGLTSRFWWRDDDAVECSKALDRLTGLSQKFAAQLVLAVIPARLQPGLVQQVADTPHLYCAQHGLSHDNNAPPGQKKIELGGGLGAAAVIDRIGRGQAILDDLMPRNHPSRLSMLVPPWNRINADVVDALPGLDFAALSCFADQPDVELPDGLARLNVHCDPINWRDDRAYTGAATALAPIIERLKAARIGDRVTTTQIGLMTHHLVHSAEVWQFVERFLAVTTDHPAIRWRQPLEH